MAPAEIHPEKLIGVPLELLVFDLMCARGGVPVLSSVSFRVATGEALCLRGPNGSGKTTLLRTLAGLQPRIAGSTSLVPDEMAYAGHADGIKATLTVAENLEFWAAVYGTREIGDALARFRLTRLARRPAQNLSAGQKRRLGLARLLVTGRKVWLLDEPTVSLDRDGVALFAEAMAAHLADGGSAVIATHIDLGFAARDLDVVNFKASPRGAGAFEEAVG